jgi:NAD(P)-dependent dehydrogenase (short-subunit alcohol dehydrogenase family)
MVRGSIAEYLTNPLISEPEELVQFSGKSIIVTGAASGIGRAAAALFAQQGGSVMIADLNKDEAEKTAVELMDRGLNARPFVCDVSDEKQVESTVDAAISEFGRLDVVVNNAGLMVFKPITDLTSDDWEKILRVDLLGAFYFTRQAFLKMKDGGAIVNVSSVHAVETSPLVAPYAAAKSALLSLTRSAALEGTAKKIRVNAVLPGAIDTPMLWNNPNVKSGVETIDKTRVGTPEDIADVIVFLASDDARFVQGACLLADGGRLDQL